MLFWCAFHFSPHLLISKKKAKNLRKFFPISKFTKLVNLLVLETQGTDSTALVHFVCTSHRSLAMTAGNVPPQSNCRNCFQPRVTEFGHGAGTGTSPRSKLLEQLWAAVPSLSYSDTLKERGRWKLLFTATALKNIETVYNWGFRWHHCYHFFSSALPTF